MNATQHLADILEANRQLVIQAETHVGVDEAIQAVMTYYSPDMVRHGDKGDTDRDYLLASLQRLYTGFPDLRREIFDVTAEADRVAYRWEAAGTHLGEYMGVRPTKKPITAQGMVLCRVQGGQVVEEWASWNRVTLLYDLGIFPIGR